MPTVWYHNNDGSTTTVQQNAKGQEVSRSTSGGGSNAPNNSPTIVNVRYGETVAQSNARSSGATEHEVARLSPSYTGADKGVLPGADKPAIAVLPSGQQVPVSQGVAAKLAEGQAQEKAQQTALQNNPNLIANKITEQQYAANQAAQYAKEYMAMGYTQAQAEKYGQGKYEALHAGERQGFAGAASDVRVVNTQKEAFEASQTARNEFLYPAPKDYYEYKEKNPQYYEKGATDVQRPAADLGFDNSLLNNETMSASGVLPKFNQQYNNTAKPNIPPNKYANETAINPFGYDSLNTFLRGKAIHPRNETYPTEKLLIKPVINPNDYHNATTELNKLLRNSAGKFGDWWEKGVSTNILGTGYGLGYNETDNGAVTFGKTAINMARAKITITPTIAGKFIAQPEETAKGITDFGVGTLDIAASAGRKILTDIPQLPYHATITNLQKRDIPEGYAQTEVSQQAFQRPYETLGTIGGMMSGAVTKYLPSLGTAKIETGITPAWKGIYTEYGGKAQPIVGVFNGKVTFGTPKIAIPEMKAGYVPETTIETAIIANPKNLEMGGYSPLEIEKIKVGTDIMATTEKQPSAFLQKEFIKETKTLSPKGVEAVIKYSKENIVKVDELYGSFVARSQTIKEFQRKAGDIDIQLKVGSEEAGKFAAGLTEKLKLSGENVRLSAEKPTLIEAMGADKEYHHAVDIHFKDMATPEGSPVVGEGAYGFKFGQKPIKIEDIPSMSLSEQGLRKGASSLSFQEGKKIMPAAHRLKDISDFYGTQKTLLESAKKSYFSFLKAGKISAAETKLERFKELYPEIDWKNAFNEGSEVKVPLLSSRKLSEKSTSIKSVSPSMRDDTKTAKEFSSPSKSIPSSSKISPSLRSVSISLKESPSKPLSPNSSTSPTPRSPSMPSGGSGYNLLKSPPSTKAPYTTQSPPSAPNYPSPPKSPPYKSPPNSPGKSSPPSSPSITREPRREIILSSERPGTFQRNENPRMRKAGVKLQFLKDGEWVASRRKFENMRQALGYGGATTLENRQFGAFRVGWEEVERTQQQPHSGAWERISSKFTERGETYLKNLPAVQRARHAKAPQPREEPFAHMNIFTMPRRH